jgi:uncharacterized protein YecE (DUF72 family)
VSTAFAKGLTGGVRIGTAGWSIPRASKPRFPVAGTQLQRYAGEFTCVEINSTFYRPHAAATYARWRDSTPAGFRFAIKMPRVITHERKLLSAREPLTAFLDQSAGLAEKRGPVLAQLPPSLAFDTTTALPFFELVRELYDGPVVCEPRHPTWFTPAVELLLTQYRISRVAADPPRVPGAMIPGGWAGLAYFRLHGSPRMYWSRYDEPFIAALAATVRGLPEATEAWCMFDNTATGSALENAWELRELAATRS